MLIVGVAALSAVTLFGCQQQGATTTTPTPAPAVTETSTASLDVMPAGSEQSSSASLSITPATQQGSTQADGSMLQGNLGAMMKDKAVTKPAIEDPSKAMTPTKAATPIEKKADVTTTTTTTTKAASY